MRCDNITSYTNAMRSYTFCIEFDPTYAAHLDQLLTEMKIPVVSAYTDLCFIECPRSIISTITSHAYVINMEELPPLVPIH